MINLFQLGEFILASGQKSNFKIECDALLKEDWEALAAMAVDQLPIRPFFKAYGVPSGGTPFAEALNKYREPFLPEAADRIVIAEDVVTTGGSMERFRSNLAAEILKDRRDKICDLSILFRAVGVCVFARGPVPEWVHPVFTMYQSMQ